MLGLVAIGALVLVAGSAAEQRGEAQWRAFVKLPGPVDVAGPLRDGRLLVASNEGLFLLRRSGSTTPFARGSTGYVPARGETYIALAKERRVPNASCSFRRDDVYALDPIDHPGVVVIQKSGRARRFVDLPAGSFLGGIAFDTVGRFGYRLLVTATTADRTTIYAIDCRGRTRAIARGLPKIEGGLAVAPATFGRYGGSLIGVDELTGYVYAFAPTGHVGVVARPALANGADLGVESVGFVPRGFKRSGAAYLADLGAPGSPTVGTNTVLELPGSEMTRMHVRAGDLLVSTEAAGITVAIRCGRRCTVRTIGRALPATHAEGHIAVVAG
jgi:hypothetical protein